MVFVIAERPSMPSFPLIRSTSSPMTKPAMVPLSCVEVIAMYTIQITSTSGIAVPIVMMLTSVEWSAIKSSVMRAYETILRMSYFSVCCSSVTRAESGSCVITKTSSSVEKSTDGSTMMVWNNAPGSTWTDATTPILIPSG